MLETLREYIDISGWFDASLNWTTNTFSAQTGCISMVLNKLTDLLVGLLQAPPPWLMLLIITCFVAWFSRRVGLTIFTILGLGLVLVMNLWNETMMTLGLVLLATIVSVAIGVPLGVLAALNKTANRILLPVLDFMQTLPAFVYLIPAVGFFGLSATAGLFATVFFAMPPAIRLTDLGIRQVPEELVECADAFGSTTMQKLVKLQLPMAMTSIRAGINQTIMLSLSMVVIAAIVGAKGVGYNVWENVQTLEKGKAFAAGLAIVILAILLDRIMQSAGKRKRAATA